MDEFTPDDGLRGAVHRLLQDGPMALHVVVEHLDEQGELDWLREDGVEDDEMAYAVADVVTVADAIWSGPDDQLVLTEQLTTGLVLTHRITAEELEFEEILSTPDLVILDLNAYNSLRLATGGRLQEWPGDPVPGESRSALVGPEGWLEGFSAGDAVAFIRNGDAVRLELVHELGDGDREVELLGRAAEHRIAGGEGEEALPLVLDAMTLDPSSFRCPVRPLAELLKSAGLEQRGFSFGRAGEDWVSAGEEWRAHHRQSVLARWEISDCCEAAFDAALADFERYRQGVEPERTAASRHLGHGTVALALHDYVTGSGLGVDGHLGGFAAALVGGPQRRSAPALHLLALDAEDRGDLAVSEEKVRASLRADPDYGPAAFTLANYEIDRGHVDAAIALLRHPDLDPGEPTLQFLQEYRTNQSRAHPSAGRNDPCPCGSGRKYKVCHQNEKSVSISDRMGLLMYKVARYARAPEHRGILVSVASAASDPDAPDAMTALSEKLQDPLVFDFGLWEGGVAESYLVDRGELLPEDERVLLGSLIDQTRQLWEITEVDSGRRLVLRDTATGNVVRVDERAGSMGRPPGEYLLARIAHLHDAAQIVGAVMSIPLHLRDSALALVDGLPDAIALATWYGEATGFPQLANREGDRLVLCRVEVSTETPIADVESALHAALEHQADGVWAEMFELANEDRVVRGTVRREGSVLTVETNSEARSEHLVYLLRNLFPDLVTLSEEYTDPRKALEERSDTDVRIADLPDQRMTALLDQVIRQKEMEWVEEPVPALGGLTPRQALNDPTRREDLLALLREFEGYTIPEGAGGFNVERIRGLLGLPGPA